MKFLLAIMLLFFSLHCLAEREFNEFTEGHYKLYGVLDVHVPNKTVVLVMYATSRRELTVRLQGVNFRKAISFNGRLVEANGYIEKRVIGKNIVFKEAKIVKIAPRYMAFTEAKKISIEPVSEPVN